MAAFDYISIRDTVAEPLLKDFGSADGLPNGTLLIPGANTGTAYNPQPGADVPQPCFVVGTVFTKEDMAGGNVEKHDRAFLVSTEGVVADPNMADRLQVGGVIYQVISIKPLKPGPIVMLWKVHARK